MKKGFVVGIICGLLVTSSVNGITPVRFYKNLIKKEQVGTVKEYWTEDLSAKILRNRKDKIIIEKCIGTVINSRKDGRILNARNKAYDYISYKGIKCNKGDTILTVFIYSPGDDVDEIETRIDYVIDTH